MCNYHLLPEHDRLESVIELIHESDRVGNQPIDLYRLYASLAVSDEAEDDEAGEANADVGLDFGYGIHGDEEMEGGSEVEEEGNVERDEIDEFLDGTWPNDGPVSDGESAVGTTYQREEDDGTHQEQHINTNAPVIAAAMAGGSASPRQNTPQMPATTQQQQNGKIIPHIRFTIRGLR